MSEINHLFTNLCSFVGIKVIDEGGCFELGKMKMNRPCPKSCGVLAFCFSGMIDVSLQRNM